MTDNASPAWLGAMTRGDRSSLARAITAVENGGDGAVEIARRARLEAGKALVVGITGPPGAGKSTLAGALLREFRQRSRTVAVLAVDPSSPLTGGALLGDRIRMVEHSGDRGVFVRSLASRGRLGGLARPASAVIDVMDAAGCDIVIVETVGTGQSETEVAGLADVRLLVWPPGSGDAIQAAKAGILETADIVVVNKADLPDAPATRAILESAVSYRADTAPPVLMTVASRRTGIAELADRMGASAGGSGAGRARRRVRDDILEALEALARERAVHHPLFDVLAEEVARGAAAPDEAARRLLDETLRNCGPTATKR